MTVKKINYAKEFLSETDQKNVYYHGCPKYKPFQNISMEDKNLRKKICGEFSFYKKFEFEGHKPDKEFGFDGIQHYKFEISGNPKTLKENPKTNVNYKTRICIVKAGNKKYSENLCDLEGFILKKGFEEIENIED